MSETTIPPYNENPGLVKTIAVLTLINGIVNILSKYRLDAIIFAK
ncbi:MAG: hypothetical protein AB8I58_04285 [Anaerolineales bacterium]